MPTSEQGQQILTLEEHKVTDSDRVDMKLTRSLELRGGGGGGDGILDYIFSLF